MSRARDTAGIIQYNHLTIDDANDRVGIGSSVPKQILDLGGDTTSLIKFSPSNYGSGASDGAQIGVNFGGLDVWQFENNYLRLGTNNTERFRITSGGSIGIGTDNPGGGSFLHVHSGADSTKNHLRLSADRGLIARLGDTSSSAQSLFDLYDTDGSTQIVKFVSGGGDNFVNTGGNLGIGTASPVALLTVGSISDSNTNTTITSSTTGTGGLYFYDGANSGALIYDHTNNFLQFRANGSEQMRIDSSGRLLLGITSYAESTTAAFKGGYGNAGNPGRIALLRQYSTIFGNNLDAEVARIIFADDNGDGDAAQIRAVIDGTSWSTTSKPTRLTFHTSASGSASPTERVRITSDGKMGVGNQDPHVDFEVGANDNDVATIAVRYSTVPGYFNNSFDGTNGLTTLSNNKYSTADGSTTWSSSANTAYATGALQLLSSTGGSQIKFLTAGSVNANPTERMRITGDGSVRIVADNQKLKLGAGDDFEIYHDGTDNVIGTDGPNIRIGTTGETFAKFINNGAVELYHDNVKTLETTASGINVKATEGGAAILELHADEGDDNIDKFRFHVADGGPFRIQNVASGGWENNLIANGNGSVELHYNDSKKLETTSGGAYVTGTLAASGIITAEAGAVGEIDTLTDGATVTPNLDASVNFTITLGGNRTLANPSAMTAGQSGSIFVVQDGTGGRSFNSFGSYWDFIGGTLPTFTSTASAVDRIDYIVRSSTKIHAVFTANYS